MKWLMAGVAVIFWTGGASAIQRYSATVLPTGFYATDRNTAGTMVGSFTNASGLSTAAMYSGGNLTLLPGADFGRAINNDGTMIAVSINSRDHGFIRAAGDGGWSQLVYPGYTDLQVFDINNAGVVGGTTRNFPGNGPNGGRGFTYSAGNFTPLPDTLYNGGVFSLNDQGDAVGRYGFGSFDWIRINDTYTTYDGSNFNGFIPVEINENQQVVGSYRNTAGITVAAVLEGGVLRDLNSRASSGFFLNNVGQMLGTDSFGLFLYDPFAGRSFNLNQWIDGDAVRGASGIFDDGTILAWRYASVPGGVESVLLTPFGAQANPVPEPASWAMVIAGFGLVGGAQRRQFRQARRGAAPPLQL